MTDIQQTTCPHCHSRVAETPTRYCGACQQYMDAFAMPQDAITLCRENLGHLGWM